METGLNTISSSENHSMMPPLTPDRLNDLVKFSVWDEFLRRCDNPGGVSDKEEKAKALERFILERRSETIRTWNDFFEVFEGEDKVVKAMDWPEFEKILGND